MLLPIWRSSARLNAGDAGAVDRQVDQDVARAERRLGGLAQHVNDGRGSVVGDLDRMLTLTEPID
jgi:hypothetical protein